MDDGKPTEPKAKWWSRPTPGRSTSTAPQEPSPVEDAVPDASDTPDVSDTPALGDAPDAGAPQDAGDAPDARPQEPVTSEIQVPAQQAAKPLHEPDQYSTPPYGGPGPWAPAPPVQRPTPAHGTPVPPPYAGPNGSGASGAGTNGAGMTLAPAPAAVQAPVAAQAPAYPPPAAPQQPQQPHHAQQPQHAPPQPQPHAPSPQWLQYDPWGAPRQPLVTNPGPPLGPEGARRRRRGPVLIGALLLALVAGGIGGGIGAYIERNGGLTQVELPQDKRDGGGRAPDSVAGIAASALPSVVTLHVSGTTESGTGTGFVLDNRGHILTNNHVVAPAGASGEITVTFSGGETADAEVVGKDSGYDLAVVKVSGVSGLKPLPLGNSDNVQVGDPVVAIGAPFDLSNTVTSGIISAKDRPITAGGEKGDGSDVSYVDALQTDAPINPGNSGGPLVDTDAHVIGINSAIRAADSGSATEGGQAGSIGLGFAIPINQGKRVAEELINTGKATHPVIGVTLDMKYTGDGAKVGPKGADGKSSVTAGGPGAKAGIRPGDVITEVNGQRVHNGEELIVKIRSHRPGDRLELTLTRAGKELSMNVTLGSATGT
ncbi:trypsin-like peptidase domain-containing protein [Streptomyces sp. ITFR-16]|uniref:S1C family serine protease n=1 Tax=Streptomyces sp. ITFR-16 TaxID=3075198 RepID=UPI0028895274|nr:trypsin-like peptidase domain-containing protein [Streptomyces sp. ITFR-16]WNI22617.1 trypsin-like peptidase domain-containing protein [Streptomyces sp. ITFR-16]